MSLWFRMDERIQRGRLSAVLDEGLAQDATLRSAVEMSLYTNARAPAELGLANRGGYWGDTGRTHTTGSLLWTLEGLKATPANVSKAQEYAKAALQWLLDDGIAGAVEVTAVYKSLVTIALYITIYRPLEVAPSLSGVWEASLAGYDAVDPGAPDRLPPPPPASALVLVSNPIDATYEQPLIDLLETAYVVTTTESVTEEELDACSFWVCPFGQSFGDAAMTQYAQDAAPGITLNYNLGNDSAADDMYWTGSAATGSSSLTDFTAYDHVLLRDAGLSAGSVALYAVAAQIYGWYGSARPMGAYDVIDGRVWVAETGSQRADVGASGLSQYRVHREMFWGGGDVTNWTANAQTLFLAGCAWLLKEPTGTAIYLLSSATSIGSTDRDFIAGLSCAEIGVIPHYWSEMLTEYAQYAAQVDALVTNANNNTTSTLNAAFQDTIPVCVCTYGAWDDSSTIDWYFGDLPGNTATSQTDVTVAEYDGILAAAGLTAGAVTVYSSGRTIGKINGATYANANVVATTGSDACVFVFEPDTGRDSDHPTSATRLQREAGFGIYDGSYWTADAQSLLRAVVLWIMG